MRATLIIEMPDEEQIDELTLQGASSGKLKRFADMRVEDGGLYLLEPMKDHSEWWKVSEVTE